MQEEEELVGPDGSQEIVLEEGRTLQVTLLSNRAEAYLRAKPPKFAEAAASAQAALTIEPANEKAQRRYLHQQPTSCLCSIRLLSQISCDDDVFEASF